MKRSRKKFFNHALALYGLREEYTRADRLVLSGTAVAGISSVSPPGRISFIDTDSHQVAAGRSALKDFLVVVALLPDMPS